LSESLTFDEFQHAEPKTAAGDEATIGRLPGDEGRGIGRQSARSANERDAIYRLTFFA